MTIEVRQLIIKSTVLADNHTQEQPPARINIESIKAELLDECRQLMSKMVAEKLER